MTSLFNSIADRLGRIYPDKDNESLTRLLIGEMELDENDTVQSLQENKWDEQDVWVITYGDSVCKQGEAPLVTLKSFADKYLKSAISGLHILPFFPYSSDAGFSVINYSQVNDHLGTWKDIENIASDYDLMSDLVINHCSSRSRWFDNFCQGKSPGKDYFIEANPEDDTSEVVRPRTSPLLRETQTIEGVKYVWCTFSHDQIDLNFTNPDVLLEMVRIIRRYLEQGVKIFRLDAVAFLWKQQGTTCLHLPQTHEIIRLLRTLIEAHTPSAIIITETNVPNHENLSYFGNANEAHAIYNFSLPPLLVHTMLSGNSDQLKQWQMSMPPAQNGTFYFNFIASHDGIGLRPINSLLDESQIDQMINTLQGFGARVSYRSVHGGRNKPYEINISLYDAMQGTIKSGSDKWQQQRFICAHAIMMSLEGVPGLYIHSLLGTQNDTSKLQSSTNNRNINRKKWQLDELETLLKDHRSHHQQVLQSLLELLTIRRQQKAFHPNAVQYTLHLGSEIFAFWRQSMNRDQSIFCIHNVTSKKVTIPTGSINIISLEDWRDLISGEDYHATTKEIELEPYQFVWLSNK